MKWRKTVCLSSKSLSQTFWRAHTVAANYSRCYYARQMATAPAIITGMVCVDDIREWIGDVLVVVAPAASLSDK